VDKPTQRPGAAESSIEGLPADTPDAKPKSGNEQLAVLHAQTKKYREHAVKVTKLAQVQKEQIEKLQQKLKELLTKNRTSEQTIAALKAEIAEFKEHSSRLEDEIDRSNDLVQANAAAEVQAELNKRISEMEAQLEALRVENSQLSAKVQEGIKHFREADLGRRKANEQVQKLEKELLDTQEGVKEVCEEKLRLELELAAAAATKVEPVTVETPDPAAAAETAKLQQEIGELHQLLESRDNDLDQLEASLTVLEGDLEERDDLILQLEAEFDLEREGLKQAIAQLEAQVAELQEAATKQVEEIEVLKTRETLRAAEGENSEISAKASNQELESLRSDLDIQHQRLAETELRLEESLTNGKLLTEELDSLRVDLAEVRANLADKAQRIEDLQVEKTDLQEELEEQLIVIEEELQTEKDRVAELSSQVEQLQAASNGSADGEQGDSRDPKAREKIQNLEKQQKEKNKKLRELEKELASQKERCEALEKTAAAEKSDLNTQLEGLQKKLELVEYELQEKVNEIERKDLDLEELHLLEEDSELEGEEKSAKLQDLEKQLATERAKVNELNGDLGAAQQLIEEMEGLLNERDERLAKENPGTQTTETKLEEWPQCAKDEILSLERRNHELESDLMSMRQRLLQAHNELEPLDNKRAKAEAKASIFQQELKDALNLISELQSKLKG
jgi:exonuclease SbcC